MAVGLKTRPFTIDEYDRMIEVGILTEDDRVELLEGTIVEMAPIGSRHASTVARITDLMVSRLREQVVVWAQHPIALREWNSEPQPDVVLLPRRDDFYRRALPMAEDVLLVIEVMESSEFKDRRVKLPLYARAGIRETWLVDNGRVEVYRQPGSQGYRDRRVAERGDSFALEAFPDVVVTLDDLLGPLAA